MPLCNLHATVIRRRIFIAVIIAAALIAAGTMTLGWAARKAAETLIQLLDHEVSASCGCRFTAAAVTFSPFTLTAVGNNARIVCADGDRVRFTRIVGRFSLRRIMNRILDLDELTLLDGFADGVGAQSPAFKFVSYLAEPLPPQQDRPGRWRLKLQRLRLSGSSFRQRFEDGEISGTPVSLFMVRKSDDNFDLHPQIGRLTLSMLRPGGDPKSLDLGRAEAVLTIRDERVDFKHLVLREGRSELAIRGSSITAAGNRLQGGATYQLHTAATVAAPLLRGVLRGNGDLAGILEEPVLNGSFHLTDDIKAELGFAPPFTAVVSRIDGRFSAGFAGGTAQASVTQFTAESQGFSLRVIEPWRYTQGSMSGKLGLSIAAAAYKEVSIRDAALLIDVNGSFAGPKFSVSGRLGSIQHAGLAVSDLDIRAHGSGDALQIEAKSSSLTRGGLTLHARLPMAAPDRIAELNFELKDLVLGLDDTLLSSLALSGAGRMAGELTVDGLTGEAQIGILTLTPYGSLTLQGPLRLSNGALSGELKAPDDTVTTTVSLPLAAAGRGALKIKFDRFKADLFSPRLSCTEITASAAYAFDGARPGGGDGTLNLDRLALGCAPYQIANPQPKILPIISGSLHLDGLAFTGPETDLHLNGRISPQIGYDLTAVGRLDLDAAAALLPAVDVLQGQLDTAISIRGPFDSPLISGQAAVTDGAVEIGSANLSLGEIEGELRFDRNRVIIDRLVGQANGGSFSLRGEAEPAMMQGRLQLAGRDILLEPGRGAAVLLSADLELASQTPGRPLLLTGVIKVQGGEMVRDFSLKTIIQAAAQYAFARSQIEQSLQGLPDIELNLKISAPRGLFLAAGLVEAELRAEVTARGRLTKPEFEGALEVLSGWIGFNDRRFEITSGRIVFAPADLEPRLEVQGQALWFSRSGVPIAVTLEALGPLSAPRVKLSSDSGLSQAELATLFTAGRDGAPPTLINAPARQSDPGRISLLTPRDDETWTVLLDRLTAVDSLAFEPTDNLRTGLLEPTLIAEKRLAPGVNLRGRTPLGTQDAQPRAEIIYNLSPRLTVAGIADSATTQRNAAFGVDLRFTALSSLRATLRIETVGHQAFSRERLQEILHLNERSKVSRAELPNLKKQLLAAYRAAGYFAAEADLSAFEGADPIETLNIVIREGPLSRVGAVQFEGGIPVQGLAAEISKAARGAAATQAWLRARRWDLLRGLRHAGFIGARITAKYKAVPGSVDRAAWFKISAGKPTRFEFSGNRAFTKDELLDTINIMRRAQPFGRNTIQSLVENIDRKYRQAGYLYIEVNYAAVPDLESGGTRYLITLHEGPRMRVVKVRFIGNRELSVERLRTLAKQRQSQHFDVIFRPESAVEEEMTENAAIIKGIYAEEGFPDADVGFVVAHRGEDRLEIRYLIAEHRPEPKTIITLEGVPPEVDLPAAPDRPVPQLQALRYLQDVEAALINAGYLHPTFFSRQDQNAVQVTYQINPGARTIIHGIFIRGLRRIPEEVVRRRLTIKPGDPWDHAKLGESKSRLLRLGLFSAVAFEPADGNLNDSAEDLEITVVERALETLEFGLGANSELGYHFFGEGSDRSLFSDGRTLSAGADIYYNYNGRQLTQGAAGLKYSDPLFLQSDYRLSGDVRFQKLDLSTLPFTVDRILFDGALYHSWKNGLAQTLSYTWLREDLTNVAPDAVLSPLDQGLLNLAFLSAAWNYDKRDNPVNPTSGLLASLDGRLAAGPLGSAADYAALGGRVAAIAPFFGQRWILADNLRAASAWNFGATSEVPISERYFIGGRTTVRGYRENSLGPRGADGSVLGGDLLFQNNLELRYLLTDVLAFDAFLDAGTVYLKERQVDLGDIRWGAGGGFRYLSPIGPIGFDIGTPIEPRRGEPVIRVHFSIGAVY